MTSAKPNYVAFLLGCCFLFSCVVARASAFTATVQQRSRVEPPPAGLSEPIVTSANIFQIPCPTKTNAWSQLIPEVSLIPAKQRRGSDVTVEWHRNDNLAQVAESMVQKLDAVRDQQVLVDHLTQCMQEYQDFCVQHLRVVAPSHSSSSCCCNDHSKEEDGAEEPTTISGFRARVVATRGPSGTKCPKWHLDVVPCRWIHALVGPGCDYVDYSGDDVNSQQQEEAEWNSIQVLLGSDDENDKERLISLLKESKTFEIRQAEEQEVALFVGKRWNECTKEQQPFVPAVLHKSPDISFWQGRVLLTMDCIVPNHLDDE